MRLMLELLLISIACTIRTAQCTLHAFKYNTNPHPWSQLHRACQFIKMECINESGMPLLVECLEEIPEDKQVLVPPQEVPSKSSDAAKEAETEALEVAPDCPTPGCKAAKRKAKGPHVSRYLSAPLHRQQKYSKTSTTLITKVG